ncbi:MAG: aldehyde dehydrogenase family protein [Myxococcales bacterium]|nr:aldehyde dehydrogenase family protein [Myxococcales bacterium]
MNDLATSALRPDTAAPDLAHVARAVAGARRAFDLGTTRPRAWRLAQLDGLARLLTEREDAILEALAADLGKPRLEGYSTEIAYTATEVADAKAHLGRWMKARRVATPLVLQPGRSYVHTQPLGVVLVIAPWNYPFGLSVGPLVGALCAGNAAVLKPSEVAPATSALIAAELGRYLDADAVRVVEGGVPETTELLRQRFDHIFYTGNGTVGQIVMTAAAKHLTPVTLELGGKSPAIVDRSADLAVTARRICWGKFINAGQTCVAPDYVLAHADIHDALVNELTATVRAFYGDAPQKSPDYARIVNARHHKRLAALLGAGKIAAGGELDEADRYIAPTILTEVEPGSAVMADEIFGPILPVLRVGSMDEAVSFVNGRPKPLALYVFAEDGAVQDDVILRTSSGGASVNHTFMHLANHELPFGGVGASGMGAYHGQASYDCFSHHRSVLVKSTRLDAPVVYPPYGETQKKLIRYLL